MDGAVANAELPSVSRDGATRERAGRLQSPDLSNLLFGEAVMRVPLAALDEPGDPRVVAVLLHRHPLKICRAIVQDVAVDVVDLPTPTMRSKQPGRRPGKSEQHQRVDSTEGAPGAHGDHQLEVAVFVLSRAHHGASDGPQAATVGVRHCPVQAANSASVAHFVPGIARNRQPALAHAATNPDSSTRASFAVALTSARASCAWSSSMP